MAPRVGPSVAKHKIHVCLKNGFIFLVTNIIRRIYDYYKLLLPLSFIHTQLYARAHTTTYVLVFIVGIKRNLFWKDGKKLL